MSSSLRFEWRRITSIRSTWILIGIAVALSAGFAILISSLSSALNDGSGESGGSDVSFNLTQGITQSATNLLVLIALGTIAAQAFGQDYRHGTIRVVLTEFPNRTQVFISKIIICCLFITVAFAISLAVAALILQVGGNVSGASDDLLGFIFRSWLYVMGFCFIVFAVTVMTRILALGIVIPLVFAAVFEPLISGLLSSYVEWLPKALPFAAGLDFASGESIVRGGLVFAAWSLGLLAVSYVMFTKRDA
jgi:ABC-2 type transport system permease protein